MACIALTSTAMAVMPKLLIARLKSFGMAVANLNIERAMGACLSMETTRMNWDRVEGNWKQVKGKVKEQWGKLTDDQLDVIAGRRDQLVGKVQEQYGISKDEAEKQVVAFEDRYRDSEFDIAQR